MRSAKLSAEPFDSVASSSAGSTPLCSTFCGPDYSGAGGGGDSELIDTQPNTLAGTTDFNDAPLKAGESYSDTGAGVTHLACSFCSA